MLHWRREMVFLFSFVVIVNQSHALQRGVPVEEGVAPGVVKLIIADGKTMPQNCTGSFITPKHILTAAHCFRKFNEKNEIIEIKKGHFSKPGISDLKTYCKGCFGAIHEVRISPDYKTPKDINHDIAIIELKDEVSLPPGAILNIANEASFQFEAEIYAFGSSKTDSIGSWHKRFGAVHVQASIDHVLGSFGDYQPYLRYKGSLTPTFIPVSVVQENSGAPLMNAQTGEVVGVVSHVGCHDIEKLEPSRALWAPPTHECPYVYQTSVSYYADLIRAENQAFVKNVLRGLKN